MSRKKALTGLISAIENLNGFDHNRHMNAAEMRVFLLCAISEGITMKALAERIGIAQSETSRIVSKFSVGLPRKPGYGLLEAKEDTIERRRKIVCLTQKGEKVVSELLAATGVSPSVVS